MTPPSLLHRAQGWLLSLRRYLGWYLHVSHSHWRRELRGRCFSDTFLVSPSRLPSPSFLVVSALPCLDRILLSLFLTSSHLSSSESTKDLAVMARTFCPLRLMQQGQCLLPVSLPVFVRFILSGWKEVVTSSYADSSFGVYPSRLFAHLRCASL